MIEIQDKIFEALRQRWPNLRVRHLTDLVTPNNILTTFEVTSRTDSGKALEVRITGRTEWLKDLVYRQKLEVRYLIGSARHLLGEALLRHVAAHLEPSGFCLRGITDDVSLWLCGTLFDSLVANACSDYDLVIRLKDGRTISPSGQMTEQKVLGLIQAAWFQHD